MPDHDDAQVLWWPEPVVVGAGALGALVAKRLVERSRTPLLVDEVGVGAGQTGACHGYVHRGHIYGLIDRRERDLLDAGADAWSRLLDEVGVRAATPTMVGFTSGAARDRHVGSWLRDGARFELASAPAGLRGVRWLYRTPESVIPLETFFRRLVGLLAIPMLRARVTSVVRRPDGLVETHLMAHGTGERRTTIVSPACVVAAGSGTASIDPATIAGQMCARESWMLAVWTREDLPASLVLPGDASMGLFLARKAAPGAHLYLISSHTVPSVGPESRWWSRWVGAVAPILREHLPELWRDPSARWGLYSTTKAELAPGTEVADVPGGGLLHAPDDPLQVALAGKLTLAPLVADAVVDRLPAPGAHPAPVGTPWEGPASTGLQAARERWWSVPFMLRDELMVAGAAPPPARPG